MDMSGGEVGVIAVEDRWVQCDACQKWRRVTDERADIRSDTTRRFTATCSMRSTLGLIGCSYRHSLFAAPVVSLCSCAAATSVSDSFSHLANAASLNSQFDSLRSPLVVFASLLKIWIVQGIVT